MKKHPCLRTCVVALLTVTLSVACVPSALALAEGDAASSSSASAASASSGPSIAAAPPAAANQGSRPFPKSAVFLPHRAEGTVIRGVLHGCPVFFAARLPEAPFVISIFFTEFPVHSLPFAASKAAFNTSSFPFSETAARCNS